MLRNIFPSPPDTNDPREDYKSPPSSMAALPTLVVVTFREGGTILLAEIELPQGEENRLL